MYFRPLSKSMIQKLKECHRMEQESDGQPCTMESLSYVMGPLYKRGFIEVRKSKVGKRILHYIYLTPTGKDFLNNLNFVYSNKFTVKKQKK